MTREVRAKSIVLCARKSGENNQTITLLCREQGIVYAALYGGPKSRLRGKVSQWNRGTASLYLSHSNDFDGGVKITDFAVEAFHLSFRECIYKDFAASVAAEVAIDTKCAGSAQECYTLVSAFLDGLEATAGEDAMRSSLVRFLWRYLSLLGVQSDAAQCAMCGGITADGAVYDSMLDGFVCQKCAASLSAQLSSMGAPFAVPSLRVGREGVGYLLAIMQQKPIVSRSIALSGSALRELTALMFVLIQNAVGHTLRSIKSGVGIL